jgi:hypothetical protein
LPVHGKFARLRRVTGDGQAAAAPRFDFGWLCLATGLFSVGWAVAILLPDVRDLPAWPAASVGIFALVFARAPGRALLRGLGAFLGVLGLLVGVGKILALWGLLELLGG